MKITTLQMAMRHVALSFMMFLILNTGIPIAESAPTDLFFSEYVEGTSNNKALEIFNGTANTIDLSTYSIQQFFNGSPTPVSTISLSGSIAPNDVFVLAHSGAGVTLVGLADALFGSLNFNGDDAIALVNNSTTLDVIGQIGFDPGTEWNSGGVSTLNSTLRRKPSIMMGDGNGFDAFSPDIEWETFPEDTFNGLGAHSTAPVPAPSAFLLFGTGIVGLLALRQRKSPK